MIGSVKSMMRSIDSLGSTFTVSIHSGRLRSFPGLFVDKKMNLVDVKRMDRLLRS